jgi:hypothetical protein
MLTIIDGATAGEPARHEVVAVVADLGPERSTVLLGTGQETWDFPREMLPERVEVGSHLFVEMIEGRPVRTRLNPEREATRRKGMDHRLERLERYERLTGHEVRVA